jgi:PAS domain S-box-containing protein
VSGAPESPESSEALRRSEERFRHLAALSSDWFWEQDSDLRFVLTGGTGMERGGISAEAHVGKLRWELPGTEIIGQTWDEHRKVLAERKPFRDLLLRRTGDAGDVHYLSVSGEPFTDAAGRFAGYRGVTSDVTQRFLAMQAARAADERLSQAIENLDEFVAVTDADDRLVVSNRAFRELNGNTGLDNPGRLYEEHLRHGITIGNYPEAVGREEAWLEERLARRRRGGTEEVRRQNGRWLLVTDQRLPNGGTITYGMDITKRKEAEEELRANRRLLEQVIDAIPMSIFAKDLGSNYVMANRYMVDFFGTTKTALLQRHTSQLPSSTATRDQSLRDDRWVFNNRKTLVHETWIEKPDGTKVPYHSSKIPLYDDSGALTGLLGINRDISAERQAQREIEEINATLEDRVRERTAQLEVANRELEAFSYSVSHDLKAPLRAIDGAAGMMKMKFGAQLPAGTEPYLARISHSVRRMGILIDGLLEFARLSRQAVHREPVQPDDLVRQVLQGNEALIQARAVKVTLGALPACQADALLLRQVFENLVANALKYSAQAQPPALEIGARREAQGVVYFVRDNGVGFDMAYADKLFGVFQRLHAPEQFEGTGIGLALVRRIIERHEGRVWAESAPGRGATFYFTIGGAGEAPAARRTG